MQICVLFVLLPVVSGLLFDLFSFKNKCQSPFHKSADDPLGKILQGFFKCPYEPTENPNLPIDNFVRFFFIQSGQTDFRVASVDDVANSINPNFTNFILIHGYTDGVQAGEWMDMVGKQIISITNANVILMDYSLISNCNYVYLASRVYNELSDLLTMNIKLWGLQVDQTRIIGHSLGAHIAGMVGTNLMRSGNQLAQIDGLDPAGPMFDVIRGLNSSCAKFVQILHTSKMLGIQQEIGDTDFFANRLKPKQPGCLTDPCSHTRAPELYYASCFPENVFVGTGCAQPNIQSRFGFFNNGLKNGCFQFDTSDCFPFTLPQFKYPPFF